MYNLASMFKSYFGIKIPKIGQLTFSFHVISKKNYKRKELKGTSAKSKLFAFFDLFVLTAVRRVHLV